MRPPYITFWYYLCSSTQSNTSTCEALEQKPYLFFFFFFTNKWHGKKQSGRSTGQAFSISDNPRILTNVSLGTCFLSRQRWKMGWLTISPNVLRTLAPKAWVARLVEHPTLDFGSSCDLGVLESSPRSGSQAQCRVCLGFILFVPPPVLARSLK